MKLLLYFHVVIRYLHRSRIKVYAINGGLPQFHLPVVRVCLQEQHECQISTEYEIVQTITSMLVSTCAFTYITKLPAGVLSV